MAGWGGEESRIIWTDRDRAGRLAACRPGSGPGHGPDADGAAHARHVCGRGRQARRAGVQGSRRPQAPDLEPQSPDPDVLRPGRQPAVRLQPRRGDPVFPRGRAARSGLRHVLVGRGVRARTEHQPAHAGRRRSPRLDGARQGAGAQSQGQPGGAGVDRRAGGPLFARSQEQPRDEPPRARRGFRHGHGRALAGLSERPRRRSTSTPRR